MGLNLNSLNIRELATLDDSKKVIELDIDLINEDSEQPRTVFTKKELDELADSIKERGIKSPISVRENPNEPGKYIINHGARRYRASILAAKNTIPAIIDNDYTFVDQIIENLQRQDLEPMEMCQAINKLISEGMKKQEVAKALGVSNAFVSQYSNLDKLPEILQTAFDNKKIEDVTVINELMTLRKKKPESVAEIDKWINKQDLITRPLVKQLRKIIEAPIVESDTLTKVSTTEVIDDFGNELEKEERLITLEDTLEIETKPINADEGIEEAKNGSADDEDAFGESFLKPNYNDIVESTTAVVELTSEQCAAILWAYDRGINALDDNAKKALEAVINSLKNEIWP